MLQNGDPTVCCPRWRTVIMKRYPAAPSLYHHHPCEGIEDKLILHAFLIHSYLVFHHGRLQIPLCSLSLKSFLFHKTLRNFVWISNYYCLLVAWSFSKCTRRIFPASRFWDPWTLLISSFPGSLSNNMSWQGGGAKRSKGLGLGYSAALWYSPHQQ